MQFSTYAIRCIDNEILMHFRKYNKTLNDVSLNESITLENHEENNIELKDTLEDKNCDFVSRYEQKEIILIIRKIFNELPEREKYIIGLYFGFFDDTPLTQREIALKLNISKTKTCRTINKILKEIRNQLETKKLIELPNKVKKLK